MAVSSPVGSSLADGFEFPADLADHVDRVRVGQDLHAHEHGPFAGETDLRVVVFAPRARRWRCRAGGRASRRC